MRTADWRTILLQQWEGGMQGSERRGGAGSVGGRRVLGSAGPNTPAAWRAGLARIGTKPSTRCRGAGRESRGLWEAGGPRG